MKKREPSKQGTATYGRGRGSRVEKRKRLFRHLRHALRLARATGEIVVAAALEPLTEERLRQELENFSRLLSP